MIEVKRSSQLTKDDTHQIQRALSSFHGAGPYHHPAWLEGCEEGYGHSSYVILKRDARGEIQGILPLVHIKPPLLAGELVSLPFCDYGGPVAKTLETKKELMARALELSKELGARLEVRLREEIAYRLPGLFPTSDKVRLVLKLEDKDPDGLFMRFKSKLRSQIRRPQKAGLEAEMGGLELLEDFYRIFAIKMHELGSPVHSKAFFRALFKGNDGEWFRIFMVRKGQEVISSSIVLFFKDSATVPWAASLREYNRLSPNMLLYWTMLAAAVERGCSWFDFGRSTPGGGTYRFKEQWGARPVPLFWYRTGSGLEKAGMAEKKTAQSGSIRPLLESAWRRLPLGMANWLGPKVRRFVSL